MGEHKYAAIGKEVTKFTPPGDDKMKQLKKFLPSFSVFTWRVSFDFFEYP